MSSPANNLASSLNFQALREPVTNADIAAFKNKESGTVGARGNGWRLLTYGAIIVVFAGLMLLGMAQSHNGIPSPFSPLITAVVAGLIVAGILLSMRIRTKQLAKLYKFAVANDLTLLHDVSNPSYTGMIFDEGHSRQIGEALQFPGGLEIGNYRYETGSGKNRQTHNWGFVRVKLSRRLPNMVLDSRKNNLFGKFSNLPDTFDKKQTLALEGDFNEHFTLYAPKEYERDALYAFTPDVMAAVIDAGKDYDMEVVDDSLLLYTHLKLSIDNESELTILLGIVDKIGTELRSQSHRYADERVGDPAQNMVAVPGQRLKTGVSWWVIALVAGVLLYYGISFFATTVGSL